MQIRYGTEASCGHLKGDVYTVYTCAFYVEYLQDFFLVVTLISTIYSCNYYVSDTMLSILNILSHFLLIATLYLKYFCFHLINERKLRVREFI